MAVITGGPGPDTLNDTPADDTIDGLGGDDTIIISAGGDDTADGNSGNDTLEIDWSTSFSDVTNDGGPTGTLATGYSGGFTNNFDRRVDYVGIERFVISTGTGNDSIITGDGDDVIRLNNGDDFAFAGGGNDNLRGGDGDDLLDGGTGADIMRGGGGDDIYFVDAGGDKVEETSPDNGAFDIVVSTISYVLGQHLEVLFLDGSADINGTGNELDNFIFGNSGNNILDGGLGDDLLFGGGGDDTYIVESASDFVVEDPGGGTDTVRSSISYTLGDNVENLRLTGTAAINGTGNDLDNVITGNDAANIIDGGVGADTMRGAGGNDVYLVDNVGDVIDENAGGGSDLVRSSVSFTLSGDVEKLALTGTAVEGIGNALDNVITGSPVDNLLRGGSGSDRLEGRDGDDDISGGLGADQLFGQDGADDFLFDTALDGTFDTIGDFEVGIDSILLKSTVFSAINGVGTLDAEAYHEGSAAAEADDRIIYDSTSGFIFYDADGSGAGAAVLFAKVTPGTDLSNTDFIVFG